MFAGVREFRDITIDVSKLVIREAGTNVWRSDENGFETQTAVKYNKVVVPDNQALLEE